VWWTVWAVGGDFGKNYFENRVFRREKILDKKRSCDKKYSDNNVGLNKIYGGNYTKLKNH